MSELARSIAILLLILGVYAWASDRDYQDAVEQEAQTHARIKT